MKNQGYPETTLKPALRRLNMLSREADLDDPEDVKAVTAKRKTGNAYKQSLVEIYNHCVKVNGLSWDKPFYKQEKRLPKVPTSEAINKIIARATPKYATIFRISPIKLIQQIPYNSNKRREEA